MTNFSESSTWESVRKWETADDAAGGTESAPMNVPLKSLVNRGKYLKTLIEAIIGGTQTLIGTLLDGSTVVNTYSGNQQKDTDVANTSFVQNAIGVRTGRRNVLLNGDMKICQRTSSLTFDAAGQYYTLDRWLLKLTSAKTAQISQENDIQRTSVPGSLYAMRVKMRTGSGMLAIRQRVENAWTFEGQKCTFSWCMYSPVAVDFNIKISQFLNQSQITAGTPQWSTYNTVSIAAGFGKYSTTFDVARLNSIDLSSLDIANCFSISLETTDTRAIDFWLTNLQLEAGAIASDFEVKDDFNACLRFFEQHSAFEQYNDAQNISDGANRYSIFRRQFYHAKRRVPDITKANIVYTALDSVSNITQAGLNGCTLELKPTSGNASTPTTRTLALDLIIDAEII
jgi:hypothetical protein